MKWADEALQFSGYSKIKFFDIVIKTKSRLDAQ